MQSTLNSIKNGFIENWGIETDFNLRTALNQVLASLPWTGHPHLSCSGPTRSLHLVWESAHVIFNGQPVQHLSVFACRSANNEF